MSTPRAAKDLISGLSDDIICRILRFVPTKDAVTTGVLSKRWINLWRNIPILDFTNINLEDHESVLRFNQFVYSILLSREAAGSPSIDTFYLGIHYSYPDDLYPLNISHITTWVNLVVQRDVKHLHLLFHLFDYVYDFNADGLPPKLPNSIFSCKTLVVLKLDLFTVVKDFSFPSVGFGLPSLTTLHMKNICFEEDRDFMLLLAACPILEDLNLYRVCFDSEAENPRISQEFKSLSFSKLIRADIAGCSFQFPMKALFYSEFLRIHLDEEYNNYRNPYDFPTFHNLTHLVLNYDWDVVIEVLHHCLNLQHLDLYQMIQGKYMLLKEPESWVDPEFAPQCLSLCLRTCTIRDFTFGDLQRHIMLARYILQNSRVLQTMTIRTYEEQPEIERELSSCPRASVTCQLSVY